VFNKEKLDDIGHQLENPPQKSSQKLAQQSGISVGSAWGATNCCIFVCIKLLLFLKDSVILCKRAWVHTGKETIQALCGV
jgi:hypothetical protein